MGHALNKILKDMTIRYEFLLKGKKIHYVPGWDCHGLPIELKALSESKAKISQAKDVREKARSFATSTIQLQKAAFQRWGVMADWDQNCYYTYLAEYVSKQLKAFHAMYEKVSALVIQKRKNKSALRMKSKIENQGLVFREYKPVYWSPSSQTALAESELEYNGSHESVAVYLKLRCNGLPPTLLHLENEAKVFVVIWTTTPWTLPANQAVCFDENQNYSLVRADHNEDGQYWIVSSESLVSLRQIWSMPLDEISQFQGDFFLVK